MKVFGQLESASLEQLSSDPAAAVAGRIYDNTTTVRVMHDNGSNKRALFRNDEKIIVGNDGTAANNVRVHKSVGAVIQDVPGSDTTLDGVAATSLAQRSVRNENQINSGLPANGNAGRNVYVTDQQVQAVDDGSNWRRLVPQFTTNDATTGSTVTLAAVTASVIRLTGAISTLQMIPAGFNAQPVTLINRTGSDFVVSNASGATPANQILTGTAANLTFKNNSSLQLYYDSTTQKWQVVGQAAGAGSGTPGLPNSSFILISGSESGTGYTALSTDDVILCDVSLGIVNVTLPNASGNLGKRLLFEKVGTRALNALTITGSLKAANGSILASEIIWANNAPYEIISDGSNWIPCSPACGAVVIKPLMNTPFNVAAASTGNVSLETLQNNTVIDNVQVKTGNAILLKNQTALEENGVYVVPASALTIAATANANVNIATLANGSTVPTSGGPVFVSTGQLVSLRFQSTASENGIYVVGATAGTSIRDTSQRHASYLTAVTLSGLIVFADWFNYPTGLTTTASSPTESVASHSFDRTLIAQTNYNITSFTGSVWSVSNPVYNVRVPINATAMELEILPFGGAGSGGLNNSRGGGGGNGAFPASFKRVVGATAGGSVQITMPLGTKPGSGGTAGAGTSAHILAVDTTNGSFNMTAPGGNSGQATGSGGALGGTSGTIDINTQGNIFKYSLSGGNGVSTSQSFWAAGGTVGSGGASGGGAGGPGIAAGSSGGNQSGIANGLGGQGGDGLPGSGGGGGGNAPPTGRAGRGGFGGIGYVILRWS